MTPRLSSVALWTISLGIAFAAGYFLAVPTASSEKEASHRSSAPPVTAHGSSSGSGSADSSSRGGPGPASAFENSEFRAQTFEVLREPDRILRMRNLCDLLTGVTRENWRDVFEGFRRQASVEGRIGTDEWNLMLRQIGRVGGADAMKFLESEKIEESDKVLTVYSGWAEADPRAAKAWTGNNLHQLDSTQTEECFYRGAASADSELALEIALQSPHAMRIYLAIVESTIQRSGLKAADELITAALSGRSTAQEKNGQGPWLFRALAEYQIKAARSANDPERVLGWLDAHIGQQYLDGEAVYHATHYAAEANPSATLDWISERMDRMTEQHAWWCLRDAASTWRTRNSDQFAEWVKTNSDHPLLERIVTGAWADFVVHHGQGEAARRWAAKVESPAINALVESWIKEVDVQKQKESAGPAPR